MAFDPYSGELWETENGDDSFSELNRVVAGMNGGWIQIAGPQHRFFDFRDIEVNEFGGALQQVRFPPTRLAIAPGEESSPGEITARASGGFPPWARASSSRSSVQPASSAAATALPPLP